jgi:hypothetical protein
MSLRWSLYPLAIGLSNFRTANSGFVSRPFTALMIADRFCRLSLRLSLFISVQLNFH